MHSVENQTDDDGYPDKESLAQAQRQLQSYFYETTRANMDSVSLPKGPVDTLLGALLTLMKGKFMLDKKYRENIHHFNASYLFKDQKETVYQRVIFKNGDMQRETKKKSEPPTFTLIFRNERSLLTLLFSPTPDVLNAMLNQEVDFIGNINYLNKFAYMALLAKPKPPF